MKAKNLGALLMAFPLFMSCFAAGCGPEKPDEDDDTDKIEGKTWTVSSPDGDLSADVVLDNYGSLFYRVKKGDVSVVEYSALGMTFEEEDLSSFLIFKSEERRTVKGSYANISGKTSQVDYECNELALTFEGFTYRLRLTMRSYDDGYAFRYNVEALDGSGGTLTVAEEKTEFALPEDSVTWIQTYKTNKTGLNTFSYEDAYVRKKATSLSDRYISMPMLYRAGDSEIYSLVTESDLIGSGYYGSFLAESSENAGRGVLQTVQSPAGVQTPGNVISCPFESPWRVGITGTLAAVTESELVEKVYDDAEYWKPDDYDTLSAEEQETYEYDWVETGTVAWSWLRYTGSISQDNFDLHREYLQLAVDMGWKYIILDGGWDASFNPNTFKEFVQDAHDVGVKVVVWCNALMTFNNGTLSSLQNKLDTWKSYGVDGIKIDFFDGQEYTTPPDFQGEDVNMIDWYESIYRETAKRRMVVIVHGSNKPTGERRVYPHVISREAVYGNEFRNVDSSYTVNSLFIRGTVGPTDFTPVVTPRSSALTMGQQMALAVLYECGAPCMADYASVYSDETINDFYKCIPSLRDETLFLCGELDEYYCSAVRVGNDWFVACANGITERTVEIDFSFLGEGDYTATYWTDVADDYKSVERSSGTVTKNTTKAMSLVKNGGFVIRLVKN